jgi:hypothetical protein
MKALKFFRQSSINYFILFLLMICSTISFAQPGDPQTDPDNPVPIHGIAYLLIGGLIIGIKKIVGSKIKAKD